MTSAKRKNISDAYTLWFPFGFRGKFTFREVNKRSQDETSLKKKNISDAYTLW